jgi:class 3 adenylate cyclase
MAEKEWTEPGQSQSQSQGGANEDSSFKEDHSKARKSITVAESVSKPTHTSAITSTSADNTRVRSIDRGSETWRALIKPFVSDLVFSSLVPRHHHQTEVRFRPYNCEAAVLFVDLSGYSRIAAAIAHKGAHALSSVVNNYLSRILDIVRTYGGDVVKFAGDAVLIVWGGEEKDTELNVLCAAQCVVELQKQAGWHPIEGTSLVFKIHCGLTCGPVESEVFEAPTHAHMQRLYHAVGGDALAEISELVDLAKAGETCISEECAEYLGRRGSYGDVPDCEGPKLLTSLHLEEADLDRIEKHIETTLIDRLIRRDVAVEEEFIHPGVLQLLNHGGLSPTQIAQMRNLCVLFIAMTSNGSPVNWLMEVQHVLDKNRCPIVQIIDDDKGVHIVAAINLYEAMPETSILGIEVCRELVEKEVGCAIGMAIGSTFCGVTGSSSVACRWDITGPPPVRAARLMQYALANNLEVAIDHSIYSHPTAPARMALFSSCVNLKGTASPVPVYTLSDSSDYSAFRVLETVHGNIHNGPVAEIQEYITGNISRCAVLVTGPPLAGKKIVCQRAAGFADMVPYLHVCCESSGFLQLARTMATWFRYVENDRVQCLANDVLRHMDSNKWSRAHDECIRLVNIVVEEGLTACFVVDRVQFLDAFSMSLIRECLHGISRINRLSSRLSRISTDTDSSSGKQSGKICFLCVHVPMYSWNSASRLVDDITRSHKRLRIPVVEVGEAAIDEFHSLLTDVGDVRVDQRLIETYYETSGHCAGYFIEKSAGIRNLSGKMMSEGKRAYMELGDDLVLHIPPGFVRKTQEMSILQISADVAMRFTQIYDDLPPLFQTLLKVVAIATSGGFFKLPLTLLWAVLNDLIAEGVDADVFDIVIKEMKDMWLLKLSQEDGQNVVIFQCPAIGDIAMDVCTPVQVSSIARALIDRLQPAVSNCFKIPFVVASLYHLLGEQEATKLALWRQGYDAFLEQSTGWVEAEAARCKELITDVIDGAGYSSFDVLGEKLCYSDTGLCMKPLSRSVQLFWFYEIPVSFGPAGHSLSVITRNTFHEYGTFRGATEEAIQKLRSSTASASNRYMKESLVLEEYLEENGFGSSEELEEERLMIELISRPAESGSAVVTKATTFLEEYRPRFLDGRLRRLKLLIVKLREGEGVPSVIENAPKAIRLAYKAMQAPGCRSDAVQVALMTLATLNWKPKPVPEFLPILRHQTVARLRNKVARRLPDSQLAYLKYQHTEDDLEIFLVVTALLYEAQNSGKC